MNFSPLNLNVNKHLLVNFGENLFNLQQLILLRNLREKKLEKIKAYERWKRYRTPELSEILRNCRRVANYEIWVAKCKFYENKSSIALSQIRNMSV